MHTRHFSRWSWLVLFALAVVLPFFAESGATQSAQGISEVKTTNSLIVIIFTFDPGKIIVNLPDDMRAGDTISGVVTPEPKGGTEDERNKNRDVLNGFVIQAGGANFPVSKGLVGPIVIPGGTVLGRPPGSTGNMPPLPPSFFDVFVEVRLGGKPIGQARVPLLPSGAVITPDPKITPPGMTPSGAVITPDPKITTPPGMTSSGAVITPDPKITPTFIIPPLGQTGRPIVITGPFDGNFDNTKLTIGGQPMKPLAESPRQVVLQSPSNVTGPSEISVKEGDKETKGAFRNVGVNLTAPKTSLLKGESTELRVEVQGLQGITQPIPLHLTNGGAVTMQGGNTQTMSIKPSEVQSNGIYTTTRTITGVEAGVWNATATVVVFDFCLQDDNNGNLLTFSSTTGDFIFCQGRSAVADPNPIALSTLNFLGTDFSGGVRVSPSDINEGGGNPNGLVNIGPGASITRNGVVTVADFNYTPGYIHVRIDDFNHTGSASGFVFQQITAPSNTSPKKVNFTITDRDTRNNTCVCK
jgi:hypothetical protein